MAGSKPTEKLSKLKTIVLATRIAGAGSVRVSGDFTQWSAEGIPLEKSADGGWKITLKLAPGDYQYRLLVDGVWRDHPEAVKQVPNPYGSQNGVLTVR